jgi:ribosomal protection tetracycline resistance protein
MGSALEPGTRDTQFIPHNDSGAEFASEMVELLVNHDDALLAAYINDETTVSYSDLRLKLAEQTKHSLTHPVFFGSAITGAGVDSLMAGVVELLPAVEGDVNAPVSGAVFKVDRGPSGEKIAYMRVFSGSIRARDRLRFREDEVQKVNSIRVFVGGSAVQRPSVEAGHIAMLWGLNDVQIGDSIGTTPATSERFNFAPPTLETAMVACDPDERAALHTALNRLAEQDPLINVRQDDVRQELYVSLYGEVQKEVIQQTLANDFDIEVEFRETTTICIERPISTGSAVETIKKPPNPFLATVGFRIEAGDIDSGIEFRLEAESRSIPLYIFKSGEEFSKAIETTVRDTLQQGLNGWQVAGCIVTMTHSGYNSPASSARDFRYLTPLVLMDALKQAGTAVCEPIHRYLLEGPADTLASALRVLARMQAIPDTQAIGNVSYTLEGEIPATRMQELQQQLRSMTRGEGILEFVFDRYEPVDDSIPTRSRTDQNPLNRKEYMQRVMGRA